MDFESDHSQVNYEAYQKHQAFDLIDDMISVYDGISFTCFSFVPNGVLAAGNYASYVYMSLRSTLTSIKTLLKDGHIADAFTLIRKLFDTVLADIYLDVVREDKYDWKESLVVKDIDEWLKGQHWIPRTDKIQSVLKKSESTKELYPFFGWDTYLKNNRELLDIHVHASSYSSILLNCQDVYIKDREKQLSNAVIVLKQIMLIHLSFIFYMNGHYMMATSHMDYLEMGETPPEGSERWIAPYAQKAFDKYIKPYPKIAAFVKSHCCLDIE